jgi:SAM-dependent methyltransferase
MQIMAVHRAANGYGGNAETYEAVRPAYPDEAVDRLVSELGIVAGTRILELGAGTGKFTRQLVSLGADVTAIEPIEAMLSRLRTEVPRARAYHGTAEAQPFGDASFDVAVAAQAWHWFAGSAVLTELERTLVHGGALGLVWNHYDATEPWVAEYYDIRYSRADADIPDHRSGAWREAFRGRTAWGPLNTSRLQHTRRVTPDQLADLMLSSSVIGGLDDAGRNAVADEVYALLRRHPATSGQSSIVLPYITECWWTRLIVSTHVDA